MFALTEIRFAGYRSFPGRLDDAPPTNVLPLRPLTLIIGKNGAGKSHVLRLLRQVVAGICSEDRLPLPNATNGRTFARSLDDNFHLRSPAHPLSVQLDWMWNGVPGSLAMVLAAPSPVEPERAIQVLSWRIKRGLDEAAGDDGSPPPWGAAPWAPLRDELRRWSGPSEALAGVRARIQSTYSVPQGRRSGLGAQGAGCVEWLYASEALQARVRDWLALNLPPSAMEVAVSQGELKLVERRGGAVMNLVEAAEGLHQVLPVVTLWQARALEGVPTLDTVEQPELHLHDALHADLGDLALRAAGLGKGTPNLDLGQRLLVETHSEGLLLRVRRRIAEGTVSASDVSLAYVGRDPRGSVLEPIRLSPEGDPERWPEGVFLERLVEAKAIAAAHRRPKAHAV